MYRNRSEPKLYKVHVWKISTTYVFNSSLLHLGNGVATIILISPWRKVRGLAVHAHIVKGMDNLTVVDINIVNRTGGEDNNGMSVKATLVQYCELRSHLLWLRPELYLLCRMAWSLLRNSILFELYGIVNNAILQHHIVIISIFFSICCNAIWVWKYCGLKKQNLKNSLNSIE